MIRRITSKGATRPIFQPRRLSLETAPGGAAVVVLLLGAIEALVEGPMLVVLLGAREVVVKASVLLVLLASRTELALDGASVILVMFRQAGPDRLLFRHSRS
jgi:hypothetical protein